MDDTLRLWGANIEARRKALMLTQSQLAEHVGVSQPTVLRWERGQMEPSLPNKLAIAASLYTDARLLFPYPTVVVREAS